MTLVLVMLSPVLPGLLLEETTEILPPEPCTAFEAFEADTVLVAEAVTETTSPDKNLIYHHDPCPRVTK